MRSSNRRPNWWVLYTIAALFVLVLFLEVTIPLSETVQCSLEITITLLFYSLVWRWLGVNERALMHEDMQRERKQKLRLLKGGLLNRRWLLERPPPSTGGRQAC